MLVVRCKAVCLSMFWSALGVLSELFPPEGEKGVGGGMNPTLSTPPVALSMLTKSAHTPPLLHTYVKMDNSQTKMLLLMRTFSTSTGNLFSYEDLVVHSESKRLI